jgi:hypothetical protein
MPLPEHAGTATTELCATLVVCSIALLGMRVVMIE